MQFVVWGIVVCTYLVYVWAFVLTAHESLGKKTENERNNENDNNINKKQQQIKSDFEAIYRFYTKKRFVRLK